MITHTGQVTDSSSADKNNGVFLKVMTDSGNVGRGLKSVCQSDPCDLTERRVRLLRAGRGDLCANASLLRSAQVGLLVCEGVESVLKHRCLGLVHLLRAAVLDELIKGWHTAPPFL